MKTYEEYFHLKENPFSIAPDPRYFYLSEGHREALAHLVFGLNSDGGFTLLTGEVGTGKTTVCRCLLEQMPENIDIAYIINPRVTVEELLATICDEFAISYPVSGATVKTYVDRINAYLLDGCEKGRRAVLIIDEAQNLSPEVLEQIRLLTNLETSQRKLLQVIMLGQSELRDLLGRPELRQLSQRVTARYHLGPLSESDTSAYVRHRLSIAGLVRGELFDATALRLLYRLSGGVPRLINVLCDRALLGVFVQETDRVDKRTLRLAAEEVSGRKVRERRARAVAVAAVSGVLFIAAVILAGAHFSLWSLPLSVVKPDGKTGGSARGVPPEVPAAAPELPTKTGNALPVSSREMAYRALFTVWGAAFSPGERKGVCDQAADQDLRCLEDRVDLEGLKGMNKPAVLRLLDGKGAEHYTALLSLSGDRATVTVGEERRTANIKEIEGAWSGDALLLWRPPRGFKQLLRPGDTGPAVGWLEEQLARRAGRNVPRTRKTVYDDEMVRQVRQFQQDSGLIPDGVVGPKTMVLLTAGANREGPVLLAGQGAE